MKVYVLFEIFDGSTKPFYVTINKEEAHKYAKEMKEYWESWNPDNKIPVREYEVRAFEEVT